MRFRVEHQISRMDAAALYRAFREQSLDYVKALPAIARCEPLNVAQATRRVRWTARDSEIPDMVRPFMKGHDLQWVEETRWDDGTLEAKSLITKPGSDLLHCQSVLRFRPGPGGVHVECEGDLKVKLPIVGSLVEYAATRAIRENMGLFLEEFAERAKAALDAAEATAAPAAAPSRPVAPEILS